MNSIFWSWQSDLNARETRDLIRDALAAAISDLDAELEERHELTSDTKGVAGSPDIVATILAKIDAAKVFVGDVTPIAVSAGGKAVANPNVLIELGYAKRALGLERIILIWNTAFDGATIEQLPFDLRGRRAPMSFHLPVGASTGDLKVARERLRNSLRDALRLSIGAATPALPSASPEWQPSVSTPALWFNPVDKLKINDSGATGAKIMAPGPYHYARILPHSWNSPLDFGNGGERPAILGSPMGYSYGTARGGFLTYSGSIHAGENEQLGSAAMQFKGTGEIWSVDAFAARYDANGRFYAETVLSSFYTFLRSNLEFFKKHGAVGPFKVKIGIDDLTGLRWTSELRWGGAPAALEDRVEATFTVNQADDEALIDALMPAWAEIAGAFGLHQMSREVMLAQLRVR